jgi:prepilin-type processing-associated H-X9-DG protein
LSSVSPPAVSADPARNCNLTHYSQWANSVRQARVKTYICPSDATNQGTLGGYASYGSNGQLFRHNYQWGAVGLSSFPAHLKDGTSNTMFYPEKVARCNSGDYNNNYWPDWGPILLSPDHGGMVTGPASVFQPNVHGDPAVCNGGRASSPHSGGINVAMGDGSVRFIRDSSDPNVWWALATPSAGDVTGGDW